MRNSLVMSATCLAAGLVGCVALPGGAGSDVSALEEPAYDSELIGNWVYTGPDSACSNVWGFAERDAFATVTTCAGARPAEFESQTIAGRFVSDSETITLRAELSTCAAVTPNPFVVRYSFSAAGDLLLKIAATTRAYERLPPRTGGVSLANSSDTEGCFDESGAFLPRVLQPL